MQITNKLVLLSGGLDSAVVLARLAQEHNRIGGLRALTFFYGQRNAPSESWAAYRLALHYGVPWTTQNLPPLPTLNPLWPRRSPGTGLNLNGQGLSPDYIPYRNCIMLSCALAEAAQHGIEEIWTGFCLDDQVPFPDCRPQWVQDFTYIANWGMPITVKIVTPLAEMSKEAIGRMAQYLQVPIAMTVSCYLGIDGPGCGHCGACETRKVAMVGFNTDAQDLAAQDRDAGWKPYIEEDGLARSKQKMERLTGTGPDMQP